MKNRPLIAVILSSLLLVSIGHNIIPHHQHLDEILSHIVYHHHDAQIYEKEFNDHFGAREDHCQYCLAFSRFNYLISFDKDIWSKSVKTVVGNCSELYSSIECQLHGEYFLCLSKGPIAYFSGFFLETSGLRAPPLSA